MIPGLEVQDMVTEDTVNGDTMTVFGRCVCPPGHAHWPHKHKVAEEVVYVIKGRMVNGSIDDQGWDR